MRNDAPVMSGHLLDARVRSDGGGLAHVPDLAVS